MNGHGTLETASVAVALVALAATQASGQCAMCGTSLQGDEPLARGIFWSVVFLISLPYTIVGAFVIGLLWAWRREKSRRENGPLHPVGGLRLAGRKEK